jgi:Lrp/AsnC family leucine-responsive transcriptional regulator
MLNLELDEIDVRILSALQADGRLTNLELADKVGLTATPCLRRVRRLQAEGVISGFSATLDRKAIGLGLTVFVAVNIEQHSQEARTGALRRFVQDAPEVVACHIVSGDSDFLLEVVVADLEAYRAFIVERLLQQDGVRSINSRFVIDTEKQRAPLPLSQLHRGAVAT